VNHGKADFGILFDEELGYAHMQAPLNMRWGGAAGDDVQFGAFFGNYDIVYSLI
jgi:hypothetical protein